MLGVMIVHHLDDPGKSSIHRRWRVKALDFPMNTREADDAAMLVPQRHFTEDNHRIGTLFRRRTNGVDDRFAGFHHLVILLMIEVYSFGGKKFVASSAQGLFLGRHAVKRDISKIAHDRSVFPILYIKRHVRYGVQQRLNLAEITNATEEIFFKSKRIELAWFHASCIQKKDTIVQADRTGNMREFKNSYGGKP